MKPAIAIVLILLAAIPVASLQAPAAANRAKVADFYGQAEKRVSRTPDRWNAVVVGDLLPPDSAVRTSAHSAILLQLPDKHSIRLGESTVLELKEVGQGSSYSFRLLTGEIWSFVNKALKPAKYEVETPSTVLGVTGTVFNISHNSTTNESSVSVDEGTVALRQGIATQSVSKGFETRVHANQIQQAFVARQDKATQKLWKTLRSKENWARPEMPPKLNKDIEKTVETLKVEREAAIKKLEEAAAKKAAEDAAKKKAAEDAAAKKAAEDAAKKKAAEDAAAKKAAQEAAQKAAQAAAAQRAAEQAAKQAAARQAAQQAAAQRAAQQKAAQEAAAQRAAQQAAKKAAQQPAPKK